MFVIGNESLNAHQTVPALSLTLFHRLVYGAPVRAKEAVSVIGSIWQEITLVYDERHYLGLLKRRDHFVINLRLILHRKESSTIYSYGNVIFQLMKTYLQVNSCQPRST